MSTLKVDAIRHNSATSDAITTHSDGTASVKAVDVGGGPLSHRNLIINGQFLVWQRATDSGSNTTDGYLTCDRWYHASSGATKQVTRQTFSPGQTDVPDNPKYYLRFAVTTGNNNVSLGQRIEGVERVQGEYTLSFWVKGTNPPGGQYSIINRQDFGSGGSVSSVVDTGVGNFTVTSSWVKKTFTFTPPSISGKTLGTTHSGFYECQVFRQPAGDNGTSAYTIDIANVQFERGSVSTKYEQRTHGEELSNCQRYYYRIEHDPAYSEITVGTMHQNGAYGVCTLQNPVPMRTKPSITVPTVTDAYSFYYSGTVNRSNTISLSGNADNLFIELSHTNYSATNGVAGILRITNASAYIEVHSEL